MPTHPDKKDKLISVAAVLLLLLQAVLSLGIIQRLNQLSQAVVTLTTSKPVDQNAPAYVENVSVDDDPTLGTKGAPVTIVGFLDYECPFCAEAMTTVREILTDYDGNVLFVYRDFPIERIHSHAFEAAEAASCAGDQDKYWEMQELLSANNTQLDIDSLRTYAGNLKLDMSQFGDCLKSDKYIDEIRHDIEEGKTYLVAATPTFFVNGNRVVGVESLRQAVKLVLESDQ